MERLNGQAHKIGLAEKKFAGYAYAVRKREEIRKRAPLTTIQTFTALGMSTPQELPDALLTGIQGGDFGWKDVYLALEEGIRSHFRNGRDEIK